MVTYTHGGSLVGEWQGGGASCILLSSHAARIWPLASCVGPPNGLPRLSAASPAILPAPARARARDRELFTTTPDVRNLSASLWSVMGTAVRGPGTRGAGCMWAHVWALRSQVVVHESLLWTCGVCDYGFRVITSTRISAAAVATALICPWPCPFSLLSCACSPFSPCP